MARAVDVRLRLAWKGYEPLDLSSREFDLLEYLAGHAERTLTRDELLRAVWGYTSAPLTRTVAKLRKKVEDNPRDPRHLLTVHGSGYRLFRDSQRCPHGRDRGVHRGG